MECFSIPHSSWVSQRVGLDIVAFSAERKLQPYYGLHLTELQFDATNCWASLRQHQPTKYPAYEIQKHPTYGMREQTDKGALLVFPSYYRRERPD